MSQPLHMWSYWRDCYGIEGAIDGYFPALRQDPIIVAARAQMEAGRLALEARVGQLARIENPDA